MVVVWGNILSLWGNVFAIAVDILVFDAFFPHNDNRKKRWSYILLFCLIFTSLSILIGTKLGYTFKMLQEIALIYVLLGISLRKRLLNISKMSFLISICQKAV